MTDSPQGRAVLITGVGTPGNLGAALLHTLAARGDTVYAVGRTRPAVEALVTEVRAKGGKAHAFATDLVDEAGMERLMAEVSALTDGRLDVLVHAAGKFIPFGPVVDGSMEVWQQMFADNATSAFVVTRGSLPMLRTARGAIVYVASVVAHGGMSPAGMAGYAAAKAALVQLMHAVADEERGTVRANAIAPGGIKTAAMVSAVGDAPGLLTLEDVVAKISYLAGPDSGDTTGEVVPM